MLLAITTSTLSLDSPEIPSSSFPSQKSSIHRTTTNRARLQTSSSCSQQNLAYHGSPLLTGQVTLYNIYVGKSSTDYSGSTTPTIIGDFSSSFSGSSYWSILEDYYSTIQGVPTFVFGGNAFLGYNANTMSLSDSDVGPIIRNAIQQHSHWALTTNAVFAIIFRGDYSFCFQSNTSPMCWNTDWCGFHSVFTNQNYIALVMGDTGFTNNKIGCSSLFNGNVYEQGIQWSGASPSGVTFVSPNNNDAADSLVSVYAHELFEATTDSYQGWFRNCDGSEMGDLCELAYGYIMTSNGRNFNVEMGGFKFLVQTEWLVSASTPACGINSTALAVETSHTAFPSEASNYVPLTATNPMTSWILYTIIAVVVVGAVLFCLIGSRAWQRCRGSRQPVPAPAFVPSVPPPLYAEVVCETQGAPPVSDIEASNYLIYQVGFDAADVRQMQPADMRALAQSFMSEGLVAREV